MIHNEAWSVLMRAVWSVLNRTPDELLEEIIIVDDYSNKVHLLETLEEYMSTSLPRKVKLVRTEKREGLIRARVIGAEIAKVSKYLRKKLLKKDSDWLGFGRLLYIEQ